MRLPKCKSRLWRELAAGRAERGGRCPVEAFECAGKVEAVPDADLGDDLVDAEIGGFKQPCRLDVAQIQQIPVRRASRDFAKTPDERIRGESGARRQCRNIEFACRMTAPLGTARCPAPCRRPHHIA